MMRSRKNSGARATATSKPAVGEAVISVTGPIRDEAQRILKDKAYLESVYKAGAEKASYIAEKTLRKVSRKSVLCPAEKGWIP